MVCVEGASIREGGCLDDTAGVFVSVSGSDGGPGTRDAPLATLQAAFDRAKADGKVVYACAETFVERVELPPGVEVYGGLDCERGWVRTAGARTVLDGGSLAADAATLRVAPFVSSVDPFAVVYDFEIVGPQPQSPGESSIAVAVHR